MAPGYGKGRARNHVFSSGAPSSDSVESAAFFSPEKSNKLELKDAVDAGNLSYFIESPNKPQWSPRFSPGKANKEDSVLTDVNIKVKRKLEFVTRQEKPAKSTKKAETSLPGWDLLDSDLDDGTTYKPKRLLREESKMSVESEADDSHSEEQHELIKFLKRESQNTEASEDESNSMKPLVPLPTIQHSPVKRNTKNYGNARSYLMEQEENEENNESDNEVNTTIETNMSPTTETFTSITHLKLHGQNSQRKDDLNFVIEGIITATSSSSILGAILELALTLFDDELGLFLTNNLSESEFISIYKKLNLRDEYQLYVWSFFVCKITESRSAFVLTDTSPVEEIIDQLYDHEGDFPTSKISKSLNLLLTQFLKRLNKKYTFKFFYLTLLLENQELIKKETLKNLLQLASTSKKNNLDENSFQLILILLESNLEKISDQKFDLDLDNLMDVLLDEPFQSKTCIILTVKLLIRLSSIFTAFQLKIEKATKVLQKMLSHIDNEEITSLYIGLLLNFIHSNNSKKLINSENIKTLYELYVKVGEASLPYLSLFIGELYVSGMLSSSNRVFHRNELNEIKLQLEKFDTQGSELMRYRIEKVLAKL